MEQGHFVRHIRKMRQLYKQRRDTFLEEAQALSPWLEFVHTEAGMSVTGWFKDDRNDIALCQQAAEEGLILSPVSHCYLEQDAAHGLVFGFTGCDEKSMQRGIHTLKGLLEDTDE